MSVRPRGALLCLTVAAAAHASAVRAQAGVPPSDDVRFCDRAGQDGADGRAWAGRLTAAGGAAGAFAEGCLLMGERRPDRAAERFERAVAGDETNAAYHLALGRAYAAAARPANVFREASLARRTRREFERAVALDPELLDAREALADYYALAPGVLGGGRERAVREAEQVRRRDAYRGGLLLAEVAERGGDADGAARELGRVAAAYPDSVVPLGRLVALHERRGGWARAWAAADRLLAAHADLPAALYTVGRLAAGSGEQLDRGASALERYVQLTGGPGDPPPAAAYWRLGQIRERQGRRDAARDVYGLALRADPAFGPARDALARLR